MTYISSSRSPRHKDSLHLTILPWLEVALLRGDVLHKLACLVAANLERCVIFTCNRSTLGSSLEKVTFSVFLKTQLDGAQMSLGTWDTIVGKHHLKWVDLKKWPWRIFHFVCDPKNGCYSPSCRKFQGSPSSQFFSRGCTENVNIKMLFWNIHGAMENCNFFVRDSQAGGNKFDVFTFYHSVFLSW